MEKKSSKIPVWAILLIIILIAGCAGVGYLWYTEKLKVDDKEKEITKLNEDVSSLKEEVDDLNKTIKENKEEETKSKNKKTETKTSETKMSIELAYGILNKYKAENLSDTDWYIKNVELVAQGDNDTYLVSYTESHPNDYETGVATIIEYKNGKWITDLPGFSGISDDIYDEYNFVDYKNEELEETSKEMNLELAYGILTKYKEENLLDADWYITSVTLKAHGDNNTYLVDYEDYNYSSEEGYEEGAQTIIKYEKGKWTTELPGWTGTSYESLSEYNFVEY